MAWQPLGPNTWQQGRFRLYKALLPTPTYWLSYGGASPARCADQAEVKAKIKEIIDAL